MSDDEENIPYFRRRNKKVLKRRKMEKLRVGELPIFLIAYWRSLGKERRKGKKTT